MLAFVACQWGYKVIALATAACLDAAAELDTGEVTVVVKYPALKDVEALNDYRAVKAELRVLTLEPQFIVGHRSLIADDRMLADRCMSDLRYRLQMICTRKRGPKRGSKKASVSVPANKAALRV